MRFTIIALIFTSLQIFAIDEVKKIDHLIKSIRESKAIFIRNGSEHIAEDAATHLEGKLSYARKRFWVFGAPKKVTAIEFIEKIASKSSTTGEKYHIKQADGKVVESEIWLKRKLKGFLVK